MANFVLNVEHSLKVFVGDLVEHVEKSEKGWARVRDSLGGSCWVPEAYLQRSGEIMTKSRMSTPLPPRRLHLAPPPLRRLPLTEGSPALTARERLSLRCRNWLQVEMDLKCYFQHEVQSVS